MKYYERSAGAVVFIIEDGTPLYLLLHGRYGWDFPHGLVRLYETDEAATIREVAEETGLKVDLIPGFREEVNFAFSKGGRTYYKQIVFFLAKSHGKDVRLSSEHDDYAWLDYRQALTRLDKDKVRLILIKAHNVVKTIEAVH